MAEGHTLIRVFAAAIAQRPYRLGIRIASSRISPGRSKSESVYAVGVASSASTSISDVITYLSPCFSKVTR